MTRLRRFAIGLIKARGLAVAETMRRLARNPRRVLDFLKMTKTTPPRDQRLTDRPPCGPPPSPRHQPRALARRALMPTRRRRRLSRPTRAPASATMVAKSAAQPPQRRHRTFTTCDGVPRDGNENQNEFALSTHPFRRIVTEEERGALMARPSPPGPDEAYGPTKISPEVLDRVRTVMSNDATLTLFGTS